jgi:hypothetical protein
VKVYCLGLFKDWITDNGYHLGDFFRYLTVFGSLELWLGFGELSRYSLVSG